MNYFSKLLIISTIILFNCINPIGLGELTPVQTSPSYQVIVGHVIDSNRTSKWPIPKSFSDSDFRRFLRTPMGGHSCKSPSIIGVNERWTRNDFRAYFGQLFHNNPTLVKKFMVMVSLVMNLPLLVGRKF